MNEQPAQFIFKLRQNITLEGDLLLAKMELEAFLPFDAQSISEILSLKERFPSLVNLTGFSKLDSHTRKNGIQGYLANGPLKLLPDLVRRVSFVQRIYCITQDTLIARDFVKQIEEPLGSVMTHYVDADYLVVEAIPFYALFEFSEVVARRSKGITDIKKNLDDLLAALLNNPTDQRARRLTEAALSAQSTTSHLSHDIHYYKAKFFPRLARSLINISAQRIGDTPHHALDNFVGSGTTLLEAATLGIPSVGIDIDPLAVLITKAKLDAIQLDSETLADQVVDIAQNIEARRNGQLQLFDISNFEEEPTLNFPAWLMKNRKMTSEIAAKLTKEINMVRSAIAGRAPQFQTLFRVLLSDAISRTIRMRFLGTGVGRFSLTFAQTPLTQIFTKSLEKYIKVAATYEWLRDNIQLEFADAQVIEADARCAPEKLGKFDVLVTSPPYLPASSGRESYAKARALSLIALGMKNHQNVDELVDESIGSMDGNGVNLNLLTEEERNIVKWLQQDELRGIKAEPTAKYFLDMRQAFTQMRRILVPGAICSVVSGKQSTFYQFSTRKALYTVQSAQLLAEEAKRVGFEVEALYDVQLVKLNKNARPRSLDDYYETIIILRNP
jgi:16S rRNA G966 N2-methylase RsmD